MSTNASSPRRFARLALLVALALGFASSDVLAQRGQDRQRGQREAPDKDTVVQTRLAALTDAVALMEAQAEQVRPILADDFDQIQALHEDARGQGRRMSREDRDVLRTTMDTQRDATTAKIEAVLAPEQIEPYRAHLKAQADKARDDMRGRRGGRGRQ